MLCTDIIKSKISGSASGGGGVSGGYTVTFKADGQDYYIANGKVISTPPNPTSESGTFSGWLDGESAVTFPYTPTENKTLNAKFVDTIADQIYTMFNVNRADYPYLCCQYGSGLYDDTYIGFGKTYQKNDDNRLITLGNIKWYVADARPSKDNSTTTEFITFVKTATFTEGSGDLYFGSNKFIYTTDNCAMPTSYAEKNWHSLEIAE